MKREKGFTLIELLAVIIILSVIMVIAVPKVLDVINKSKEEAFIDSAYGISDSAKYYYFENNMTDSYNFEYENGKCFRRTALQNHLHRNKKYDDKIREKRRASG